MDRADQDHTACAHLLMSNHEPVVVPGPVLVELDWLASSRLGPTAFLSMLTDIREGAVRVVDLTRDDYQRVHELCRDFADLPLGFVDAAVLAVVERLGEQKLATLDHRHFRIVRPRHTPSLVLLPEVNSG
jgi:uncharacterized protein